MHELKKVEPISLAKIYGISGAIIGFVVGIIIATISLFVGATTAQSVAFGPFIGVLGVVAVIITPIFYGIAGFLAGVISAFIYNVIAGQIGGVLVELEEVGTFKPAVKKQLKGKR